MAATLSDSDSSSSRTGACSNIEATLCDDEEEDKDDDEAVAPCFHSFSSTSLLFVSVHWSVISHVRLRGVIPVGISSRAPRSDNVWVVWYISDKWELAAWWKPSVARESPDV